MAPRMRTVLVLALLLVGCGGSSSETPPPLEPDPTSYRYTGPRIPRANEETSTPAEAEAADPDDLPVAPKMPARATWGSAPARSAVPAPSVPPEPHGIE